MRDRVTFTCDDEAVEVEVEPGAMLLSVLREQLGKRSVKDGCAPQGQCGCCTVLVDGEPRVACVTPATRVAGRTVTTVDGLDSQTRDRLVDAFVATGASQCGFCTPGILLRAAPLVAAGTTSRAEIDRRLAAHLCRCTGWLPIVEAVERAAQGTIEARERDLARAGERARLEGGVPQRVGTDVVLGRGGFADDGAPRDARVAVPLPPGSGAESLEAAGIRWVVGESLDAARAAAGKVQGRRSSAVPGPALPLPPVPDGGVRLATGWVEPAYLEPDASWCAPGGEPAAPLANGGAFGGKSESLAPRAARELADRLGVPVRALCSREDVVRLGPKRPPVAGTAVLRGGTVTMRGSVVAGGERAFARFESPYRVGVQATWAPVALRGPGVSPRLRAAGLAEQTVLLEGALAEAGADRVSLAADERTAAVVLDVVARVPGGALGGASVELDPGTGALTRVTVRVAAGDPLDAVVLRSYAIGAVHMALGWVLTEGLAVDPETGDVLDLTIRSYGVLRPRHVPAVDVEILDDPGPPLVAASDAVFAAVAAATWNALARDGLRPETFPARETRTARLLRR